MVAGEGATLSEPRKGRVRAAAASMYFEREAEGRVAGRFFFWYFSLEPNKEKYQTCFLCFKD
jgi:hypothetical protein